MSIAIAGNPVSVTPMPNGEAGAPLWCTSASAGAKPLRPGVTGIGIETEAPPVNGSTSTSCSTPRSGTSRWASCKLHAGFPS